jgi:mannosyltransferase
MTSRRESWIILALIVAAATILRLGLVERASLWADEIFSLAIATGHSLEHSATVANPNLGDFVEPDRSLPAEEFRRYLRHEDPSASLARVIRAVWLSDTSPPLYYILLYLWTRILGTSDLVLRLFSTVCSVACLPLIAGVARRTGGNRAILPACTLFALSPLGIYYSTEGRMYSLLWLCVLTSAWLSLVLRERGGSIAIYLLWIASSAAGFLTHYFFVFPWIAILIFLAIRPGRCRRVGLLACVFLTGVAILPWYLVAPASLSNWRITGEWLKARPGGFHRFHALVIQCVQFFSTTDFHGQRILRWSSYASLALFGVLLAIMAWRLRSRVFSGPRLLLWLWFAAACAAPSAVDIVQHTYTASVPRYALAALPAAYLLLAIGIGQLGHWRGVFVLLLVALFWSPALKDMYRQNSRSFEPFRQIARAAVSSDNSPDLILVHSIPSGVLGIARYTDSSATIASWVGQLGNRRVPESLPPLIEDRRRIIFINIHAVGQPAPEEEWLRRNADLIREKRAGNALLAEFRLNGVASF